MTTDDLPRAGALAARLVAQHHGFDPARFMDLPNADVGYARYFGAELKRDEAVLLVAEDDEAVFGYAYGRLEERSYNELLDACGKLHDVFVDERGRGRGAGETLVREVIARLEAKGAPRVVLLTAVQNASAQRLFARLGFRTTMLELTREAVSPSRT